MIQAVERRRLSCRIVFGLLLSIWAGHCFAADRLLVDDFSIDQASIVTGRFAAFDTLVDPRLFAGGREISGGGANNSGTCATCTMAAGVHDGVFEVSVNDIPYGAGDVIWPAFTGTTGFDISNFSVLTFDVVWIDGPVQSRINFRDVDRTLKSVNVVLSSNGPYSIEIPSGFDTHDVQHIGLSFLVGARQSFAITSVELVVPEPAAHSMTLIFATIGLGRVRRVRRLRHCRW